MVKYLFAVKEMVYQTLKDVPATRNDDNLLYLEICKRINPSSTALPMAEFLRRRYEMNLPPFETVRRSRAKVQADNPELSANEYIRNLRKQMEADYEALANG